MAKFKLFSTNCTRCQNEFYATQISEDVFCPFCGYSFKDSKIVRREYIRTTMETECVLSNGFGEIAVVTVDYSEVGVGLKNALEFPFGKDDKLDVMINHLEIKSSAQVKWIKNSPVQLSRAGLIFI